MKASLRDEVYVALINRIRFYHYICGVLVNQQTDPLCRICKAYANTLSAIKKDIEDFAGAPQAEFACLPPDAFRMYEEARSGITAIPESDNPSGQKKAGNCRMPEGVCFIKYSKALLDRI